MKTLDLNQMESFQGGEIDCSTEGRIAFIAGAGVAGAIFGAGIGGLFAGYAALAITVAACDE